MDTTLDYHHIIALGLCTLTLAICHYLSPYLKRVPGLDPKRITSFAGGVAVGYVFLHMLPEIVESHHKIHALLSAHGAMSPFKDLAVFVIALLGFELFYVLDRLTYNGQTTNQNAAYRLNLGMYFIYNFIITYTLILRVASGLFYAVLFTAAMGLHFVLSDNHFMRYYPNLFGRRTHIFLVAGLLCGFVASLLLPVNIYAAAMLTAFLSGAVLYNAFSEEIALERQSSIGFFFLGTGVMAVLLAAELLHF
jgi:hypothetical protein